MDGALTPQDMSPGLLKVAVRARREPDAQFHSVAHLIDVAALERAYHRQRKDAAVGVDGVTKQAYGRDLDVNLRDLHGRLKTMRYRHQPIRRVHIPKDKGRTRPLGISARYGTDLRRNLTSVRSRTRSYRTPCVKCCRPSTSRTFWNARMVFDHVDALTMRFAPLTGWRAGAK